MTGGQEQARDATEAVSALAHALYELENGPDLVFVRAQAEAGGVAGAEAAAVVEELARLWEHYPMATAAVERLEAAAGNDGAELDRLLAPDGLVLPDGRRMSVVGFLADLHRRAVAAAGGAARLAGAARVNIARLDAATATMAGLRRRAEVAGVADDPELVAARTAVDLAVAALAADPCHPAPLAGVDRALQGAARRLEEVEAARRELPERLAAAGAQLSELRRLVHEGADGLERARSRIARPEGLLEPLDPGGIDGDERSLGPWLDRITEQAAAGGWRAAAEGLDRWSKVADGWTANARRVAAANTAAVRRRNELRGLLAAYRAKAVARGGAEDPDLAALHATASDAALTAPCDLAVAEAAVRRYVDAVNASARSGR